jgi:hypothetical protein
MIELKESITVFDKQTNKSGAKGIIKSKMVAECGGREGFLEAKASGDVWEVVKNGKSLWYSNEEEEYHEHGVAENSKLVAGTRKIDKDDAIALRAVTIKIKSNNTSALELHLVVNSQGTIKGT